MKNANIIFMFTAISVVLTSVWAAATPELSRPSISLDSRPQITPADQAGGDVMPPTNCQNTHYYLLLRDEYPVLRLRDATNFSSGLYVWNVQLLLRKF